jgi:hypothetical protein
MPKPDALAILRKPPTSAPDQDAVEGRKTPRGRETFRERVDVRGRWQPSRHRRQLGRRRGAGSSRCGRFSHTAQQRRPPHPSREAI